MTGPALAALPPRSILLPLVVAMLPLFAACGGDPPCPEVRLPDQDAVLPWEGSGTEPLIRGSVNGRELLFLLDTGFPRSVLSPNAAQGIDLSEPVDLQLGDVQLKNVRFALLLEPLGLDGIIGSDFLRSLPLIFDARERTTTVRTAFDAPADGSVPLAWAGPPEVACDEAPAGPEPFTRPLPHVEHSVNGSTGWFVLDTGATVTFVGDALIPANAPALSGVAVASGFIGGFFATARRAAVQRTGGLEVRQSPVLSAPALNTALESISQACSATGGCGPVQSLSGFLGGSFFREARMRLDSRNPDDDSRFVRFEPFDTQDHWARDYVGMGLYLAPSATPPGIRIIAFLSQSPARDAGLLVGDVITAVDGIPVTSQEALSGTVGTSKILSVVRDGTALDHTVVIADLLPDAP